MTKVLSFFFLVVSFLGQNFSRDWDVTSSSFVPAPPEYLGNKLNVKFVKSFLGTGLLASDLVWIDLLIKSDVNRDNQGFSPFYKAAKTILALDPDNVFACYFAGMYLSVIKNDVKGATSLLKEGAATLEEKKLEKQPGAWKVFFALGYNVLFEEKDFEEGSRWVEKAALHPDAPLYVKRLGQHVANEKGRLEVASRILTDVYSRTVKPEEKKIIEKKLLDLASQQEMFDLNDKFDFYLRSTGAYALPKERAFKSFLRSNSHSGKDFLGRKLGISASGKISVHTK